MHGGISNNVPSVDSINLVDRKMEPPEEDCLMSDLLWADPAKNEDKDIDYEFNEVRMVSVIFGQNPTNKLLKKEGLKSIIRAHQCQQKGYKMHKWNGKDNFPPVITVFSAPNYSNSGNDGAVLMINVDDFRIETFEEQENLPYLLPDYNPL